MGSPGSQLSLDFGLFLPCGGFEHGSVPSLARLAFVLAPTPSLTHPSRGR